MLKSRLNLYISVCASATLLLCFAASPRRLTLPPSVGGCLALQQNKANNYGFFFTGFIFFSFNYRCSLWLQPGLKSWEQCNNNCHVAYFLNTFCGWRSSESYIVGLILWNCCTNFPMAKLQQELRLLLYSAPFLRFLRLIRLQ